MAFQTQNARELANRKILEELQLKKQMLLKQGAVSSLSSTPISPSMPVTSPSMPVTSPTNVPANVAPDVNKMSSAQAAALAQANAQSFGYFISQDSSFGNLILPVLPRFED